MATGPFFVKPSCTGATCLAQTAIPLPSSSLVINNFFGQPLLSFPSFIDRKLAHERRQRLLTDPIHRCFDSSAHDLPPLPIGSAVVAQNPKTKLWDLHATIISSLSDGRSYLIVDDSGRESKRNRRHLRADLAN